MTQRVKRAERKAKRRSGDYGFVYNRGLLGMRLPCPSPLPELWAERERSMRACYEMAGIPTGPSLTATKPWRDPESLMALRTYLFGANVAVSLAKLGDDDAKG